ncbi:hypothetical protein [Streptomyces canus]|uniref:hypothetical protein n=1 Tax=Streptomyces canus TaxID=58343 RepID=UPI0037F2B55B
MTGMRIQEWSTLLLPELGLTGGLRPAVADVDLAACAKYGRPRSVYVPRDAMELLDPYLLLERPEIVRHVTGLSQISNQKLAPHMFRRTMAMLTREFPGSEIAVGMQLKHVATRALANTTTQGYTEPSPAWAQHLRTAISERRFEWLAELFAADGRGEPIGYGPGADRLRETFAVIRANAAEIRATNQAQRGDLRVELDLLRRTRLSVRFGKLNHGTMDDANPVGAKCLEDAIVPEGHQGPLNRCQPSRCANSVIAPAHLPIWTAERASLTGLLATRKLPSNRRRLLTEQLHDVDRMIQKATP